MNLSRPNYILHKTVQLETILRLESVEIQKRRQPSEDRDVTSRYHRWRWRNVVQQQQNASEIVNDSPRNRRRTFKFAGLFRKMKEEEASHGRIKLVTFLVELFFSRLGDYSFIS